MKAWKDCSEGECAMRATVLIILCGLMIWFSIPPIVATWERWSDYCDYKQKYPWVKVPRE